MSNPNLNYSNLDSRYASPSQVDTKIAVQATTDAGQYLSQTSISNFEPVGAGSAYFRAAVIGDSTTAGGLRATDDATVIIGSSWGTMSGGGEQKGGAASWFTWMCLYSNGRITAHYNGGISSDTTTGMLARFSTILNSGANLIFIGDAHNDFTSSFPEATTRANIISMITQARRAGITVVLRTIYPDVSASTAAPIRRHNTWLMKYAADNHLHIVDTYGAVVDPASTTGAWIAGYSTDGTHPTVAAAIIAGKRALDGMTGLLRGPSTYNPWLPTDSVVGSQLLQSPLFLVDINNDQVADGWGATATGSVRSVTDGVLTNGSPTVTSASGNFVSDDIGRVVTGTGIPANAAIRTVNSPTSITLHTNATATATGVTLGFSNLGRQLVTDSAVVGKVMRLVVSGGSASVNQNPAVDGTTIAVGDRLRWVGMLKFEGATAGNLIPQPILAALGSSPSYASAPVTYANGVDTGWFSFSVEITVPVGATIIRVGLTTTSGTGNIYFGQHGLYNLTKLG